VRRALGVLAVAAATTFGCRSIDGPVGGELSVRFTTPRVTDRAVLFFVVGAQRGVTAPTGSSYRVVSDTSGVGDTTWIAVIAPQGSGVTAGEIARLAVPDLSKSAAYTIALTDIAAADYSVGGISGVSLTVVKP
jgi:hypothetical protein